MAQLTVTNDGVVGRIKRMNNAGISLADCAYMCFVKESIRFELEKRNSEAFYAWLNDPQNINNPSVYFK